VNYITERGANQVVMGEREIANSMLNIMLAAKDRAPQACPT